MFCLFLIQERKALYIRPAEKLQRLSYNFKTVTGDCTRINTAIEEHIHSSLINKPEKHLYILPSEGILEMTLSTKHQGNVC